MIAKAKCKYIRMSPTKVRQVVDVIRGKDVPNSVALLSNINKRASSVIKKVLISALSNAKQKGLAEEQLFVSKIVADQGPSWKRFRAVAFGRATSVIKRTTHLTIELDLITK